MSRENVELVQSIYVDWERGDYSSAQWADPEIEFVFADGPDPGAWRGLAAMAEANRDWLQAWVNVRQIAEEYRELDDERVLVLHRHIASGKTSGLELGHAPNTLPRRRVLSLIDMGGEGAAVFHIRGGKVIRLVHYFDRAGAFEAVENSE